MKKQQSEKSSLNSRQTKRGGGSLQRWMEWGYIATLTAVTLVILPDVQDSTILKPYLFYAGCLLLTGLGLTWFLSKEQPKFSFSLIHLTSIAFIAATALSLINAYNLRLGFLDLAFHSGLVLVCFLAGLLFKDEAGESRFLITIETLCWITCAVGLLQALELLPEKFQILSAGRDAISTLGNATYFGGFLALLLPIMIARIITATTHPARVARVILVALILFLIVQSETRSAWIAGILGMIFFALINFKSKKVKYGTLALIGLGILIIGFLSKDIIALRIAGLFDVSSTSSVTRRLFFYEGAWRAFLASPIIGNGAGNFILFLPKFRSPDYWTFKSEDLVPHAHNEFLEIASELGIIGLLAFIALLIAVGVAVVRALKTATGKRRTLLVGYVSSLVCVLVDNLFSLNLRTAPVAMLFWTVLGIIAIYSKPLFVIGEKWSVQRESALKLVPLFFASVAIVWVATSAVQAFKSERNVIEGIIATWKNNDAFAVEKFKQAVEFDSTHSLATYMLAASYLKQKRYFEAKISAERLIREYPYYPKAHLVLSLSSFKMGDTALAVESIKKEIALGDSPQAYYYYAYFVSKDTNTSFERELLFTMLRRNMAGKDPEFASEGIERLRFICGNEEARKECAELLENVVSAFPAKAKILLATAECFAEFRKFSASKELLERAEQSDDDLHEFVERMTRLRSYLSLVQEQGEGNTN